ncbi:oligosaccharide flippase family protein [bacterium]|nr:oligosaccharide flippase family protein [bacterium]
MAYQLVVMPFLKLNPILTRVAFPLFVKRQSDNAALRRGYLDLLRLIAFVIFPMVSGLAVVAPLFVPLVLGDEWERTAGLIQILALLGMLKALANPSGSILLAKGRADIGFYFNATLVTVNTAVFLLIVPLGVEALALSYVIVSCCFFLVTWQILKRLIRIQWRDLTTLLPLLTATLIMVGAVGLFLALPIATSQPDFITLIASIALGVMMYGMSSCLLMRPYLYDLWQLVRQRQ